MEVNIPHVHHAFQQSLNSIVFDLMKAKRENRLHFKGLYLFGSVARGQTTPFSDIDILLTYDERPNIDERVEYEEYIDEIAVHPIDIVGRSEKSLPNSPMGFGSAILRDRILIWKED